MHGAKKHASKLGGDKVPYPVTTGPAKACRKNSRSHQGKAESGGKRRRYNEKWRKKKRAKIMRTLWRTSILISLILFSNMYKAYVLLSHLYMCIFVRPRGEDYCKRTNILVSAEID